MKAAAEGGAEAGHEDEAKEGRVKIVFYKNGFTVDGGPLRSYDDDAGRAFMTDLDNQYVTHARAFN